MKLGDKVHCHAYLQKYSDGVFMRCSMPGKDVTGSAWGEAPDVKAYKNEYTKNGWEETEIADLSGFEGEAVPKQYRRRVEEEFDGVFVGFTRIVVSGRIGTDMTERVCNEYGDVAEVYHLTKETDKQKAAVVYFRNNARRYVPIEDMEMKKGVNIMPDTMSNEELDILISQQIDQAAEEYEEALRKVRDNGQAD